MCHKPTLIKSSNQNWHVWHDGIETDIQIKNFLSCVLNWHDSRETFYEHSFGSWIAVNENGNFVTSPGFLGCYWCVKNGINFNLNHLKNDNNFKWNAKYVLSDLQSDELGTDGTFFTSEIDGTLRLGAALYGNLDSSFKAESYLEYLKPKESLSFSEKLSISIEPFAKLDTGILFSGGRDSLALAIAMQQIKGRGNLKLFYVAQDDVASGGNLEAAKSIAKLIKEDLIIERPKNKIYFNDIKVFNELVDGLMKKTLVSVVAPTNAFKFKGILIDGQNFDAMLGWKIPKMRQGSSQLSLKLLPYKVHYFLTNLIFHNMLQKNSFVKQIYSVIMHIVAKIALIINKKRVANIYKSNTGEIKYNDFLFGKNNARKFINLVEEELKNLNALSLTNFKSMYFYCYPAKVNFSSRYLFYNNKLRRPIHHSIFASHWCEQIRFKDCWNYKHALDDFIKENLGQRKYKKLLNILEHSDRYISEYRSEFKLDKNVSVKMRSILDKSNYLLSKMDIESSKEIKIRVQEAHLMIDKFEKNVSGNTYLGRDLHKIMRLLNYIQLSSPK